ncbi:hypothetical protein VCJ71_10250 [Alteriqipengyuania sp. WL0013]|uniref:hypothetical protein n=1 Tax=Alteriqipengyuania sp. WL0013 TaxID=3110773 RepID=UPI002B92F05C|nr:hypothetical protein [Alteriqipengyuania sp. WL0013]MEB3416448.1 hypothetical protein [Alteriqipengyuania sp. WL0013]
MSGLLILLMFLGVIGKAPQTADLYEHVNHAEMKDRLASCGLNKFEIFMDKLTQTDVIFISDDELSVAELECVARATVRSFYEIEFSDDRIATLFHDAEGPIRAPIEAERRERRRTEKRAYLKSRSDLGPPPVRFDNETEFAFAKRIEEYCGSEAEGLFSNELEGLTVSPAWLGRDDIYESATFAAFRCAMSVLTLEGIQFRIVGNAQYRTPNRTQAD